MSSWHGGSSCTPACSDMGNSLGGLGGCAARMCLQLRCSGVLLRHRNRLAPSPGGYRKGEDRERRQLRCSGVLLRHLVRLAPWSRIWASLRRMISASLALRWSAVGMDASVFLGPSEVPEVCMSSKSLCGLGPFLGCLRRCPVGCGLLQRVMWRRWGMTAQYWHSQCPTHCRQCPLAVRLLWISRGSQTRLHCWSLPCLLAALVRPHLLQACVLAKEVRKCWRCQCISVRTVRGRCTGP